MLLKLMTGFVHDLVKEVIEDLETLSGESSGPVVYIAKAALCLLQVPPFFPMTAYGKLDVIPDCV